MAKSPLTGQYAKPRSKQTEIIDGVEYPSFRGHNVNGLDKDDRLPDPERLLSAYFHGAATVNHVRSLLASGFASLPSMSASTALWPDGTSISKMTAVSVPSP